MPIKCPHCNEVIELEIIINPRKAGEESIFHITRQEYSIEQARSAEDKMYIVLGYEADKDRFRVVRRKR